MHSPSWNAVALGILQQPGSNALATAERVRHAMDSLKKSMKWDEDVYGLEYDLDIFMIVAVDDTMPVVDPTSAPTKESSVITTRFEVGA